MPMVAASTYQSRAATWSATPRRTRPAVHQRTADSPPTYRSADRPTTPVANGRTRSQSPNASGPPGGHAELSSKPMRDPAPMRTTADQAR